MAEVAVLPLRRNSSMRTQCILAAGGLAGVIFASSVLSSPAFVSSHASGTTRHASCGIGHRSCSTRALPLARNSVRKQSASDSSPEPVPTRSGTAVASAVAAAVSTVVALSRGVRIQKLGRRWRRLAVSACAGVVAVAGPAVAMARVSKRVASVYEEKQANMITTAFLGALFVVAYFNSKKEDDSEDRRIKSEVERLVRLKKEFEEAEATDEEGMTDDSMAAALRKAQEQMKQQMEEEAKAAAEAEAEGEEDPKAPPPPAPV